jgi:hypothetical protein
MLNAADVLSSTPAQRKIIITNQAGILADDNEIEVSRKLSQVINTFIEDYINKIIQDDQNHTNGSTLSCLNVSQKIDDEIALFRPIAIGKLNKANPSRADLIRNAKNLYELAGASKLAGANKVTRNLSTTMGLLWERIANISPYAINPEIEFNLKIKGIDLISKNKQSNVIEYQQLKTKRDTLTGSQKGRSVSELEIHDNPVFCACFSLAGWTFNDPNIPRISGPEFWSRIGIDYSIFEEKVKFLFVDLENVFITL